MCIVGEVIARDDEGLALGTDEVSDRFLNPRGDSVDIETRDLGAQSGGVGTLPCLREDFGGEEQGEARDVRASGAEAVVGRSAGQREGRFDDVEAGHRFGVCRRVGATCGRVGPRGFDDGVTGAKEVSVEAEDATSLSKIRQGAGTQDGVGAVLGDRRVLDETSLRQRSLHGGDDAGAGRGSGRTGEERETSTTIRLRLSGKFTE